MTVNRCCCYILSAQHGHKWKITVVKRDICKMILAENIVPRWLELISQRRAMF